MFKIFIMNSATLFRSGFSRFNIMKLVKKIGTKREKSGRKQMHAMFLCEGCDSVVERNYQNGLRQKTCGCVSQSKTHGDSTKDSKYHKLYIKWLSMRKRCYDKMDKRYYRYGGRGIIVCEEWRYTYQIFKKWAINNGYKSDLQIDRIDNNGNYEPSNCRFVTNKENCRNTSVTKLTADKVNAIIDLHKTGKYRYEVLQEIFGVGRTTIIRVLNDGRWE